MSRLRAIITPRLLQWCRERVNLRTDEAARKLGVEDGAIRAWESGESQPTLTQARNLAKAYGRPLAVFYLDEVPEDFGLIRDFRRLSGEPMAQGYPYDLLLLIRELQSRQLWIREVVEEIDSPPLDFVKSVSRNASPSAIGEKIRARLGLTDEEQLSWKPGSAALNAWVDRVESLGVFVSQASVQRKVEVQPARGFALVDAYAPYVFINAKDSYGARVFTLAHELAHIWVGESGVSGADLGAGSGPDEDRLERYCNSIAGAVVFPDRFVARFFTTRASEAELVPRIETAASGTGVSRDVVARRLLDRKMLSQATYERLHALYVKEWKASQKDRVGGGSYYVNHSRRLSKAFVRLVADAYSRGRITGAEASSLMQAKLDNMNRLVEAAQNGHHD